MQKQKEFAMKNSHVFLSRRRNGCDRHRIWAHRRWHLGCDYCGSAGSWVEPESDLRKCFIRAQVSGLEKTCWRSPHSSICGRYSELHSSKRQGNRRPRRSRGTAIVIFESTSTDRRKMAQNRLNETAADAIRDRYQTLFASPFAPSIRYEQMPGADERVAYAVEFAAYRLGQIDEKMGRLIEIMERGTAPSS